MPAIPIPFLVQHHSNLVVTSAVSFSIFYTTLLSSITLYRVSPFHPLYKYPGPFLAKVSKLWNVRVMMTGKNYLVIKQLHAKYGPYVRIGKLYLLYSNSLSLYDELGPNELSITDVNAISSVLGANGMTKGPSTFYQ